MLHRVRLEREREMREINIYFETLSKSLFAPIFTHTVLCIHSRVIFRGYLTEDLVSEDDNRRKLRGSVDCTQLKLRTRYIFY